MSYNRSIQSSTPHVPVGRREPRYARRRFPRELSTIDSVPTAQLSDDDDEAAPDFRA